MAGSSDLNLLKSWNPKLSKNKQKVQKKEQEAIEEEKKIRLLAKERELNDLATAKTKTGLEWMYEVPKDQAPKPSKTNSPDSENNVPTINSKQKLHITKKTKYDKEDPMNKFKVAKKASKRR